MGTLLPPLLSGDDLPWAELQAARLDGELVAVGASMMPLDTVDDARTRALSLRPIATERMIAELDTAAWVWGALALMPQRPQFCVDSTARTTRNLRGIVSVREVVLDTDDVERFDDIGVCTPLRTAVELARLGETWGAREVAIVASLARTARFDLVDVEALMLRRRNLPHKRTALDRLAAALAVPLNCAVSPS